LWGVISRSTHRADLVIYWIEETLKSISQLNLNGFIHCNLWRSNVVVDYHGNFCAHNFDECLHKEHGRARVRRGHYKYSAPETMLRPGQSIYNQINDNVNRDCFAVGVMAWEFATDIHAFANVEKDSN
jgi:hypothetical protein